MPRPDAAVAVGGSAASLPGWSALCSSRARLQRALQVLGEAPAGHVADATRLDPERVRYARWMLILAAATETLGCPLTIGRGLREGVLLELAGA